MKNTQVQSCGPSESGRPIAMEGEHSCLWLQPPSSMAEVPAVHHQALHDASSSRNAQGRQQVCPLCPLCLEHDLANLEYYSPFLQGFRREQFFSFAAFLSVDLPAMFLSPCVCQALDLNGPEFEFQVHHLVPLWAGYLSLCTLSGKSSESKAYLLEL